MSEHKFQRPIMAPEYLDYDGNPIGGVDGPNVTSVNGQSGEVTLDASDVGAKDSSYTPTWTEITDKPSEFPATSTSVENAVSSKTEIAALTQIADPTAATAEDNANKLNSIIVALKA